MPLADWTAEEWVAIGTIAQCAIAGAAVAFAVRIGRTQGKILGKQFELDQQLSKIEAERATREREPIVRVASFRMETREQAPQQPIDWSVGAVAVSPYNWPDPGSWGPPRAFLTIVNAGAGPALDIEFDAHYSKGWETGRHFLRALVPNQSVDVELRPPPKNLEWQRPVEISDFTITYGRCRDRDGNEHPVT